MTDPRFSHSASTRCAKPRFTTCLPVGLCLFLFALGLVGCGRQDTPKVPASDGPVEARDEAEEGVDDSATASDDTDHHEAALAKLSAEDQGLAERQGICPVTEKPLGWMGTPVKITVEGRDVLLCCAGCEDAVREAPEEHFEKLDRD